MKCKKISLSFFFLLALSGLFFLPLPVRADESVIVGADGTVIEQRDDADMDTGQEEAVSGDTAVSDRQVEANRAQATMASLFGKNAVIAVPPRMRGTVALPSFDSKNIEIDQGSAGQSGDSGLDSRDSSKREP